MITTQDRRSFLSSMLRAGVASFILPSAATYLRHWKPPTLAKVAINPRWRTATHDIIFLPSEDFWLPQNYMGEWKWEPSVVDENGRYLANLGQVK